MDFIDDNKPCNCQSYDKKVYNVMNKDGLDDEVKQKMIDNFDKYKDLLVEMDINELREKMYEEGITIQYKKIINKGTEKEKVKIDKVIEYKMLFRSTGKAKKGSVIFINKKLYKKALDFLRMGIKLPKSNAPIVEISAYSSLSASTIIDKVKIVPENILILKDVDSFFKTKIVSIEVNQDNECVSKYIDNYELKNTMFDGESLIDSSIFPKHADGYILLRQHFFKSATFCCHLQQFFKDYYGKDYKTAKVKDMFGNDHYVKDIQMITTDQSTKWLKFDIDYAYWCNKVRANGCMFGIVKTAHKSKLGNVQKMSYQMVNSLNTDIMEGVVKESLDYIKELKTNNNVFMEYLLRNANFSNDYEVLIDLCKQNPKFVRSDYFRERKKYIISTYTKLFRTGKVIQNADNLVFIGSPYAFLLHSVGESVENDKTLVQEEGTIQCYTKRFKDGEYLAGFRSPHNSPNNILYLHNTYSDEMEKYFEFGNQIIALNVNHTDVQDRANGCDFDSDSGFITNQPHIVQHAKECYIKYPTIVNNIPLSGKSVYNNTPKDFAKMDNSLAQAQILIGRSSNLAQIGLTYSFNFDDNKFKDYVCILSVLAQASIDRAKRVYVVDLENEIKRIEKDLDIKNNGYPVFWSLIKGTDTIKQNINYKLKCPMNYLSTVKIEKPRSNESTLPIKDFFNKDIKIEPNERRKSKKVEDLIRKYRINLYNSLNKNKEDYYEDRDFMSYEFDELIEDIKKIYVSKNYIGLFYWLIKKAFISSKDTDLKYNKSLLLKTLYTVNSDNLLRCFIKE